MHRGVDKPLLTLFCPLCGPLLALYIFTSNLDEKGLNLLFSVYIMFIKSYFLFSRVSAKKMRNSSNLMKRKALGMSHKKEKRSNKAARDTHTHKKKKEKKKD